MSVSRDNDVYKGLVTMVIEKALLDMGEPVYDQIVRSLRVKYHCHLPDCYEHPQYLVEALKELYGNAHRTIIKSINEQLEEFSDQKTITKFLKVICT